MDPQATCPSWYTTDESAVKRSCVESRPGGGGQAGRTRARLPARLPAASGGPGRRRTAAPGPARSALATVVVAAVVVVAAMASHVGVVHQALDVVLGYVLLAL